MQSNFCARVPQIRVAVGRVKQPLECNLPLVKRQVLKGARALVRSKLTHQYSSGYTTRHLPLARKLSGRVTWQGANVHSLNILVVVHYNKPAEAASTSRT